jgi:hypothetical protein
MRALLVAAAILVTASFGGCTCGGGKTVVEQSKQTCGQELTDLKAAFDKGALSQKEYERLRKATLDRCD